MKYLFRLPFLNSSDCLAMDSMNNILQNNKLSSLPIIFFNNYIYGCDDTIFPPDMWNLCT